MRMTYPQCMVKKLKRPISQIIIMVKTLFIHWALNAFLIQDDNDDFTKHLHIRCTSYGNVCDAIVNGGSRENLVAKPRWRNYHLRRWNILNLTNSLSKRPMRQSQNIYYFVDFFYIPYKDKVWGDIVWWTYSFIKERVKIFLSLSKLISRHKASIKGMMVAIFQNLNLIKKSRGSRVPQALTGINWCIILQLSLHLQLFMILFWMKFLMAFLLLRVLILLWALYFQIKQQLIPKRVHTNSKESEELQQLIDEFLEGLIWERMSTYVVPNLFQRRWLRRVWIIEL